MENFDGISRNISLLYRKAGLLNLYLSRSSKLEVREERITEDLNILKGLIGEIEREIS